MVCTGSGSIGSGDNYTNLLEASGVSTISGEPVDDQDPWTDPLGFPPVTIGIIKDARDVAIGDRVEKDAELTWPYTVVNTGGQPLENVVVTDDQGVEVFCPATELAIGESMQCTGTGSVGDGESYTNVGTAVGTPKWRGDPGSSESTWSAPLSEPIPEPEGPGGPTTPPLLTPPVSDGPPRLPTTGGDSPVFLYAMSGLLLAAGALMVFRRKREERAVNQNRIAEPSSE